MGIDEHISTFAGRTIVPFEHAATLNQPGAVALRIDVDFESAEQGTTIRERFEQLSRCENLSRLEALVIGSWGEPWETDAGPVVQELVALSGRLPRLKALFLGDITAEECDISAIRQTDCSPLWAAFPQLEELRIRGAEGLSLGEIQHDSLRKLVLEAGGLSSAVVREVVSARLPRLEQLELWLGTEECGGDSCLADLAPLLAGRGFESLTSLGLRNSSLTDQIASGLAAAPLLGRLQQLDLSLGTLGDEGARALLNSSRLSSLRKLDLHRHFLTDPVIEQLKALPLEVNVTGQQQPDDWGDGEFHRYVSVSE